ncbi:MAG: S1C family serine protease, partial [Acidimicrobiales bacterium]
MTRTVLAWPAAVAGAALLLAGCTGGGGGTAAGSSSSTAATSTTTTTAKTKTTGASSPNPAYALQKAFINVVDKLRPSVVEITDSVGLGSGIVFDSKGDIVTNDHVVLNANSFKVQLPTGGPPVSATLVGAYPADDLAVIHISGNHHLHPASFGDSSKLKVGEIVMAIGNPLGLASSVTNGIISATGRTVVEPAKGTHSPGGTIANAIQTSAPINPGNSGGALVDLAGQVVGIPTLAAVDKQIGGAAVGIGFAIPSNTVKDIASQLIKYGHVVNSHRAALGVEVQPVFDQATGRPAGVGIARVVKGGGAAKAGLKAGEVITAVNGSAVQSLSDLKKILAQLKP